MTIDTTATLFDHLDDAAAAGSTTNDAAAATIADVADVIVAPQMPPRANLSPAASKEAFATAMRALVRSRLRGEINFEQFRYGRPGYTHADYERDIAEYRERMRQRPSEGRLRPIRWVTRALEAGPVDAAAAAPANSTTTPDCGQRVG